MLIIYKININFLMLWGNGINGINGIHIFIKFDFLFKNYLFIKNNKYEATFKTSE